MESLGGFNILRQEKCFKQVIVWYSGIKARTLNDSGSVSYLIKLNMLFVRQANEELSNVFQLSQTEEQM